jgi:hypothetical protein
MLYCAYNTNLEPEWFRRYSDELQAGWRWFDSRQGQEIFLFPITSRPVLGPTQPPIQWVPGALSPGLKRPGREALSGAEVKNGGAVNI